MDVDYYFIYSSLICQVFDEAIDFSLDAGVPDPLPFEDKLAGMLEANEAFLRPEQLQIGHRWC